ncbi:hypothetical protein [Streptomyces lasiicapitis]|uniref:hypothetical protein n=1 Tax=Streptomyces lasiicapitis TaxID=1923961 RepID=UPI00364D3C12
MALDITALLDAVVSHALASGRFEMVNQHEPKNAPSTGGLTAAVWVDDTMAIRGSGLDSVSALLVFNVRVYTSAQQEPADAIDPAVVAAVDALCRAYAGDFTLGDLVRHVDLLGVYGQPLRARAGYLSQDGVPFRVMTIWLPCVVNDLWTEAP